MKVLVAPVDGERAASGFRGYSAYPEETSSSCRVDEEVIMSLFRRRRIHEELANRIALKAYGAGSNGKPNIPRRPLRG